MIRSTYALTLFVLTSLSLASSAAETTSPLDLVPKDAAGFVHLRFGDVWKHDAFAPVRDYLTRTEPAILKDFEGQFGFVPADVDTLTLIYPTFNMQSLTPPIVVVRTARPYDKARLLTALRAVSATHVDELRFNGWEGRSEPARTTIEKAPIPMGRPEAPPLPPMEKKELEPQCAPPDEPDHAHDPFEPRLPKLNLRARHYLLNRHHGHLYCLDEQTLVFAPPTRADPGRSILPFIVQLLRRTEKGLLDPALAAAAKHTAVIAMDARAFATILPQKLGSEDERLLRPLTSATLAMLSLDLGKELSATFTFHGENEADAKKLEDAVHGSIGTIKKGIPEWRKEAKRSLVPELATLLIDQMELAVNKFVVKQSDNAVTVTTAIRPDDAFAAALKAGMAQVKTARERTISQNNLMQLGLGLHSYQDAQGRLPFPGIAKSGAPLGPGNNNPNLSWRVAILPYVEQGNLYRQFKLDEPWDSEHNKALIDKMPKIFAPVNGVKADKGHTFYQIFTGREAFKSGMRFTDITDGLSNTLMVVESGDAVPWTRPEDMLYDTKKPLPKLGALFNGDFNALFMDGSVRFIRKSIEEKSLRALITPAGGEVVVDWEK